MLILVVSLLPVFASPLAAQEVDRPCAEAVAPANDFQSTGIGLTSEEPADLYGEGEILILYTYQQEAIEPGPIQRVELRTLELPE